MLREQWNLFLRVRLKRQVAPKAEHRRNRKSLAPNQRQLNSASVSQSGYYKALKRQGCDAEQASERAKKAAWQS
jgi:hypothetical protein